MVSESTFMVFQLTNGVLILVLVEDGLRALNKKEYNVAYISS